jgi:hypothetical protein
LEPLSEAPCWALSRRQFGDFADDGIIKGVFGCALGDVAERLRLSPESHASLRRWMSAATKLWRKTKTTMVPQAKARVAHSEMRQAALRMGVLPVFEDIAYPAHGSNQRRLSGAVYLAAQTVDVDVDDVGVRLNAHAPHLVEDHGARDDAASVPAQIFEEDKLLLGELKDLAAARGLAPQRSSSRSCTRRRVASLAAGLLRLSRLRRRASNSASAKGLVR